ncbi:hypothetical protein [Puniceicoccus vermicola]|uniref:YnbE-like lipoprotein n=1 Tax=Puniceicoccus vermicola TaxID=388746 RepID=A0A7X1B2E6_9BACT|nr:hypothetical protein [Puniceicoccus vermicola]MBC2604373.1 hypothetical protein [Puniceicoccus vermicola]
MPKVLFLWSLPFLPLLLASCTTHHEITHRVEPVHIIVDVNVQVEEQLNSFFDDLDSQSKTVITEDSSS